MKCSLSPSPFSLTFCFTSLDSFLLSPPFPFLYIYRPLLFLLFPDPARVLTFWRSTISSPFWFGAKPWLLKMFLHLCVKFWPTLSPELDFYNDSIKQFAEIGLLGAFHCASIVERWRQKKIVRRRKGVPYCYTAFSPLASGIVLCNFSWTWCSVWTS